MPSPAKTPAERAIAALIYAPVGLGAKLVDDMPAALDNARQKIVFARFIGKMAVDQGLQELRLRVESTPTESETDLAAVSEEDDAFAVVASTAAHAPAQSTETTSGSEELALPDYDQSPASHIVGKLAGLTSKELDAIEAYEMAHRHRRTVLGKIAQLRVA